MSSTVPVSISDVVRGLVQKFDYNLVAWLTASGDSQVVEWENDTDTPTVEQQMRLVTLADLMDWSESLTPEALNAIRGGNYSKALEVASH